MTRVPLSRTPLPVAWQQSWPSMRLILLTVADLGGGTRKDIEEATGLGRRTVMRLVPPLVHVGLLLDLDGALTVTSATTAPLPVSGATTAPPSAAIGATVALEPLADRLTGAMVAPSDQIDAMVAPAEAAPSTNPDIGGNLVPNGPPHTPPLNPHLSSRGDSAAEQSAITSRPAGVSNDIQRPDPSVQPRKSPGEIRLETAAAALVGELLAAFEGAANAENRRVLLSRLRARLRDNGVTEEAVTERADAIRRAWPAFRVDRWFADNKPTLVNPWYLLDTQKRLEDFAHRALRLAPGDRAADLAAEIVDWWKGQRAAAGLEVDMTADVEGRKRLHAILASRIDHPDFESLHKPWVYSRLAAVLKPGSTARYLNTDTLAHCARSADALHAAGCQSRAASKGRANQRPVRDSEDYV